MKYKVLIILALISGCCSRLFAQPTFGLQLGANVSSLRGEEHYETNTPRFSVSAYLYSEIPLTRDGFIALETGLNYSPQGMIHGKITTDNTTTHNLTVTNKLDYIVLPIYIKENFTNIYTKIGPYVSYLFNVSSKTKEEISQAYQVIQTNHFDNEEFVDNANMFDYGVSFGVGYIHYFDQARRRRRRRGKRSIPIMQVDLKYNIGLNTIDSQGDTPNMDYKNRVFMIGLTISNVYNK